MARLEAPMEPSQQVEIQLGHMCNNRCVFCVSGQKTQLREAFPVAGGPILERIRAQRAAGMQKLTLLGGEPTLQPEFLSIVREAVRLGFEEIVVFTNGVKTARASFLDEILATGGNFTFRFSFQGATREAHERTTRKEGSFGRLVESMKNAHARQQRVTVNMCVVTTNYESVAEFPALILPYGATQLHLDMMRPLDAGVRTEEEMRAMLPRYSLLVPHLTRMIAGFPEGFDVNLGNLPYCVAPHLARWIHHDGERTMTIAIDGREEVSEPWDKYEVKRRDKLKTEACRACAFDDACSGFFDTYRRFYGLDEIAPITPEKLATIDPERRLFTVHLKPHLARLDGWTPPAPFASPTIAIDSFAREARLAFAAPQGALVVALRPPGGGVASTDRFSMHLLEAPGDGPLTRSHLRALFSRLADVAGTTVVHPVGDDAVLLAERPPQLAPLVNPRLAQWLKHLRARAPFGRLTWRDVSLSSAGREAVLDFADPAGAQVRVTLSLKGQAMSGAYKLADAAAPPSSELVDGLTRLFGVLREGGSPAEQPREAARQ